VLKYRSGEVGLWNVIGDPNSVSIQSKPQSVRTYCEAIRDAKKTALAQYAVQLEDFRRRSETRTSHAVAGYERGKITKAAGVPEEMERRWLTVTLEAGRRLFLDPSPRIYGILSSQRRARFP